MPKQDYLIAPSILAANFARLGEECDNVLAAGADVIHFDVMDNHYVPNLTIGPMVCKALRDHGITAPIDVHLMVSPVDDLIGMFAEAGASYIAFHPEASQHVDRSLQLIKSHGCKAGLVLNPATRPECLEYVMDKLDMILLMSVNPGFGGQKFIPSRGRLRHLRQGRLRRRHPANARGAGAGLRAYTAQEGTEWPCHCLIPPCATRLCYSPV